MYIHHSTQHISYLISPIAQNAHKRANMHTCTYIHCLDSSPPLHWSGLIIIRGEHVIPRLGLRSAFSRMNWLSFGLFGGLQEGKRESGEEAQVKQGSARKTERMASLGYEWEEFNDEWDVLDKVGILRERMIRCSIRCGIRCDIGIWRRMRYTMSHLLLRMTRFSLSSGWTWGSTVTPVQPLSYWTPLT